MEGLEKLVNFIIINWFDCSGIRIWNRVKCRFHWIIWRVNFNTTIINGMIIKSTHGRPNHRTCYRRICLIFEVKWWISDVPLFWWLIWFTTTKCVGLVHISSNTGWEEVRSTDDTCISLVSNYYTELVNNILPDAESYNDCLESCCIIVGVIWSANIMRAVTWSSQVSWGSNNL